MLGYRGVETKWKHLIDLEYLDNPSEIAANAGSTFQLKTDAD